MASTNDTTSATRRNQVMVGELPEDFLRVPVDVAQAQVMADERVARLVQAQQQGGFVAIPANTVGRLTITVAQAKLNKNYGLTKMDPYVRMRIGHSVFETPTDYNGAKTPRWNRNVNVYLPHGVDSMYLEIFDERQLTMDERIAWAYITIPQSTFNGDTADDWFPLSGKQGDEKEGMINLVMTMTKVEQPPVVYPQQSVQVIPSSYPPQLGPGYAPQLVYQQMPCQPQQLQQQQQPQRPLFTDEDLTQIKELFPNMEEEVIKSVLEANRGNKESTINALLQMNSD
ncbi:toll-interacting protein B-like isoform X1 [Mytilus galloprovincialis]|uniref:Toll-interacting protein n=1 Tax=Mytilus galloprovincialis TaxID=29158 RepID=A0A8B6HM33_MYTGA|nr:toll-interacting protein [Mytilus galloprovincialis]